MEKIILIKNISKLYGAFKAVDDLTLSVNIGEFFGFLGPNGAGKTTTIRMITGIINPDAGSVEVAGLNHANRKEINKIIGAVPESRGFYEWMTGWECLSFFGKLYGLDDGERIQKLLDQVGLLKNKNKKISAYSRGMKQRLGLARALINNPKLLILDEPTLGLDPQGQEDIKNLLIKLNKSGTTIFYSSHLLSEVENLCSRVAIINEGKLVAEGTVPELKSNTKSQTLTEVFLNLTKPNYD